MACAPDEAFPSVISCFVSFRLPITISLFLSIPAPLGGCAIEALIEEQVQRGSAFIRRYTQILTHMKFLAQSTRPMTPALTNANARARNYS